MEMTRTFALPGVSGIALGMIAQQEVDLEVELSEKQRKCTISLISRYGLMKSPVHHPNTSNRYGPSFLLSGAFPLETYPCLYTLLTPHFCSFSAYLSVVLFLLSRDPALLEVRF